MMATLALTVTPHPLPAGQARGLKADAARDLSRKGRGEFAAHHLPPLPLWERAAARVRKGLRPLRGLGRRGEGL